ncbi:WSC domain-containing protein [Triangularia setosa]|uniref:WSC domain-containing protein n=1 Tax=Triangularia setosa TaxID=2587417 RepID=A0AAN6VZD3_9PEZI|nr:WSC domain-containing protein [Podospora setosa]
MASLKAVAALAAATLVGRVTATEVFLPPCLDPFQPFVYSGCFSEASGTQILPYRSPESPDDMTVEKCVAECKGNGYRYAGLVYYGVCYCGQTVKGDLTEESECSFPCKGDDSQICGANGKFSIYQDPTFIPVDQTTIEDYDPLGCWTDNSPQGRALSYRQDSVDGATMTTAKCLQACHASGFPFAGTEYGGECYCGVVIGNDTYSAPASECNMACNGASDEKCGGPGRLNLYAADELLSLQPCGYEPPVVSSSTELPPASTVTTESSTSTPVVEESTTSTVEEPTTTPLPTLPPTTSTTAPVSTTSTTSSVCVTTTVIPPKCEYKCGKWCSNPIPDWDNDVKSCKAAWTNCLLQVASCFKQAGFPQSLECFNFGQWCSDVDDYCVKTPKGGKKHDFFGKKPPKGGNPATTLTVTTACPTVAPTSTKPATTTTKPATTTTICPTPAPTNICKQPTNNHYGYKPGKPVGGIDLPVVTCNDLVSDWPSYPFKRYSDPDTRKCKKYSRSTPSTACADACKEQYEDCLDVYAEGCRGNGKKYKPRADSYFGQMEKRTFWGGWNDSFNGAKDKCRAQYNDCLAVNRNVDVKGKCGKFCE